VNGSDTRTTVIDDFQAALVQAVRPENAQHLTQKLVLKSIRLAMEFAMFSGLIVDTAHDGTVTIRSPDPKKSRSLRVS
jgi:hypothetical protein